MHWYTPESVLRVDLTNRAPDAIIVARASEVASPPFLVQLYMTLSLGRFVSLKQSNTAGNFSTTVFRRDGKPTFPETQIFKKKFKVRRTWCSREGENFMRYVFDMCWWEYKGLSLSECNLEVLKGAFITGKKHYKYFSVWPQWKVRIVFSCRVPKSEVCFILILKNMKLIERKQNSTIAASCSLLPKNSNARLNKNNCYQYTYSKRNEALQIYFQQYNRLNC